MYAVLNTVEGKFLTFGPDEDILTLEKATELAADFNSRRSDKTSPYAVVSVQIVN